MHHHIIFSYALLQWFRFWPRSQAWQRSVLCCADRHRRLLILIKFSNFLATEHIFFFWQKTPEKRFIVVYIRSIFVYPQKLSIKKLRDEKNRINWSTLHVPTQNSFVCRCILSSSCHRVSSSYHPPSIAFKLVLVFLEVG